MIQRFLRDVKEACTNHKLDEELQTISNYLTWRIKSDEDALAVYFLNNFLSLIKWKNLLQFRKEDINRMFFRTFHYSCNGLDIDIKIPFFGMLSFSLSFDHRIYKRVGDEWTQTDTIFIETNAFYEEDGIDYYFNLEINYEPEEVEDLPPDLNEDILDDDLEDRGGVDQNDDASTNNQVIVKISTKDPSYAITISKEDKLYDYFSRCKTDKDAKLVIKNALGFYNFFTHELVKDFDYVRYPLESTINEYKTYSIDLLKVERDKILHGIIDIMDNIDIHLLEKCGVTIRDEDGEWATSEGYIQELKVLSVYLKTIDNLLKEKIS